MKKIEASKLNRSLKEVLDAVAAGGKVEITRYGKVVAKLVPPNAREPKMVEPADLPGLAEAVAEVKNIPQPTPDQIRQKRRDFLLNRINKPPKS